MSTYSRPHLTYEKQLDQLKSRGLAVTDDAAALAYLKRLGYYRLSAYWYPFRRPDARDIKGKILSRKDEFIAGTTFQQAVELYVFDKRLKQVCPQSHWQRRTVELLKAMPTVEAVQLDLRALGCPDDWEAHEFWQR
jgi:abortive infection bacteriophage resistance protein